jgi:hypothetical protein
MKTGIGVWTINQHTSAIATLPLRVARLLHQNKKKRIAMAISTGWDNRVCSIALQFTFYREYLS